MFAFADVMHLLTNEFTRLSAGRLAFTRVLTRTRDGFSFRHKTSSCRESSSLCGGACIRDCLYEGKTFSVERRRGHSCEDKRSVGQQMGNIRHPPERADVKP